jgi:hypothetical protein
MLRAVRLQATPLTIANLRIPFGAAGTSAVRSRLRACRSVPSQGRHAEITLELEVGDLYVFCTDGVSKRTTRKAGSSTCRVCHRRQHLRKRRRSHRRGIFEAVQVRANAAERRSDGGRPKDHRVNGWTPGPRGRAVARES